MRNKSVFIIFFLLVFFSRAAAADNPAIAVEKLKKYNPDGQKYAFVKDYLTSLSYLNINGKRKDKEAGIIQSVNLKEKDRIQKLKDNLIQDNINFRVARNTIKRYVSPKTENGLILKAAELFVKVCDEQIDFNQQERDLLSKVSIPKDEDETTNPLDDRVFSESQQKLAALRKDSLMQLFETSSLATKILISDKTDNYGNFNRLGITQQQRRNLLNKIDDFPGDGFKGELREGQTFLEGSVSIIRKILDDYYTWDTLDG